MYKYHIKDETKTIILNKNNIIYSIPEDLKNIDYQNYLKWVEEGNIAEEYKVEGIE